MTGFPWAQGDPLLANDLNAAIANAATMFPPPGDGVFVPPGGSIQAAHDALPASGGEVTLSPDTTYLLTASLIIGKPNVTIQAIVLEHDHSAHGWHDGASHRGSGVGGRVRHSKCDGGRQWTGEYRRKFRGLRKRC